MGAVSARVPSRRVHDGGASFLVEIGNTSVPSPMVEGSGVEGAEGVDREAGPPRLSNNSLRNRSDRGEVKWASDIRKSLSPQLVLSEHSRGGVGRIHIPDCSVRDHSLLSRCWPNVCHPTDTQL